MNIAFWRCESMPFIDCCQKVDMLSDRSSGMNFVHTTIPGIISPEITHIGPRRHKLEECGMTRSQSEAIANTIIAAVAPLATKTDLE